MNFDQRTACAMELVIEFLDTLCPPRGLGADQQATRIAQISDAFARRMPTEGDFAEKTQGVLQRVRDTHLSNTWPAVAVFVMAMPEENKSVRAPSTFEGGDWKRAEADRMMAGKPVAESFVFGIRSKWLLDDGLVTPDVLQSYRFGVVQEFRETYGSQADQMLLARYGESVRPFLSKQMEAAE